MYIWKFIILLLTVSYGAALSAETFGPLQPLTFSKLKPEDTLIVRLDSGGCFGGQTHELTFSQASELTVSVVELSQKAARDGVAIPQTSRVHLGTLALSSSDVDGLDRLMKFYRSWRIGGGCTIVNHITFTQQSDGETVATQQIEDDSCRTFEMNDLTTFSELISRLEPLEQL
ncbi:MAG: hypothetical protein WBG66_09370 [Geitlerinemataceae cyanobacterium]